MTVFTKSVKIKIKTWSEIICLFIYVIYIIYDSILYT